MAPWELVRVSSCRTHGQGGGDAPAAVCCGVLGSTCGCRWAVRVQGGAWVGVCSGVCVSVGVCTCKEGAGRG